MPPPLSRLLPALLLLLLTGLAACGSEKPREDVKATENAATDTTPSDPGTAADPTGTITFIDGFEAAAATAKSPDQLIFVYVGTHSPT